MEKRQEDRVQLQGLVSRWHFNEVKRIQRELGLTQVKTLCRIIESYPKEGGPSSLTEKATISPAVSLDKDALDAITKKVAELQFQLKWLRTVVADIYFDHEWLIRKELQGLENQDENRRLAQDWLTNNLAQIERDATAKVAARDRASRQVGTEPTTASVRSQ